MDEPSGRPLVPQWWKEDEGEPLRSAAWGFASALDGSDAEQTRRQQFLAYLSAYLGRPCTSLTDFVPSTSMLTPGTNIGRAPRNLTRIYVDAAMSRFAKTETRVQYLSEGGSIVDQEAGEIGTDAANALLEQTESEVELRRGALHACLFDLGSVKVVDHDDGPINEHVPSWEIMFDPADAHRGKPTILVQRFAADREALVAEFCSPEDGDDQQELDRKVQLADDIRRSSIGGMVAADYTKTDQHCLVFELWRLPVGKFPGKHVVVTDRALCLSAPWTEKKFPFAFFGYSAAPIGMYPESIAAIVAGLQAEDAGVTARIGQVLRLCGVPRYLDEGPDGTTEVQLRGGTDAIGDVIKVPPGHTLSAMNNGQLIAPEMFNYREQLKSDGYEMVGISPQTAVGSRPAGLNSAPAQREWNEINQDRLSLVALDYQRAHVDLGELLLASVGRIPDYAIHIKDPNGRWLRKVTVAELQLEKRTYRLQAFPVGALPTTPTGKLAAAADLLQAGAIDKDEFQDIVQFPDLKSVMNIRLASRKATQKLLARMLTTGQYIAPPDALDLTYGAKYAAALYVQGIADDMPSDRLQLLSDWLDDIKGRLDKAAASAAAPSTAGTSIAPLTPPPLAPNPAEIATASAPMALPPQAGLGLA